MWPFCGFVYARCSMVSEESREEKALVAESEASRCLELAESCHVWRSVNRPVNAKRSNENWKKKLKIEVCVATEIPVPTRCHIIHASARCLKTLRSCEWPIDHRTSAAPEPRSSEYPPNVYRTRSWRTLFSKKQKRKRKKRRKLHLRSPTFTSRRFHEQFWDLNAGCWECWDHGSASNRSGG